MHHSPVQASGSLISVRKSFSVAAGIAQPAEKPGYGTEERNIADKHIQFLSQGSTPVLGPKQHPILLARGPVAQ